MDRRVNGNRGAKRARRRSLPPVLALLAVLAAPATALAQQTTFYLDRLQMAGAPDDGISVWRPQMSEATRFYGQLGLGFSLNPYRVENYVDTDDQSAIVERENGAPVAAQLTTYVSAGVEILERFGFQLSFPLAVYQDGNSLVNTKAKIREAVDFQSVAPMDLRLDGRVVFFRNEAKTLKLGAIASLWFPTGNEYSFGGDTTTTGALGVAAEYDAKVVAVAINAGYHFRPAARLNDFKVADELTYGLGAWFPLKDGQFRIGAEVNGSLGTRENVLGDVDNAPVEWRVEGRMGLGKDPSQVWIGVSGGSRLSAGYAPDFRGVAVLGGWFPVTDTKPKERDFLYVFPKDSDNDKLADDIDMCPTAQEDGKGSNPDDGCPELLNDLDSDGVPDAQDACIREPGVKSPDPAKNGCPEFIRRAKDSDKIEVLQEVEFAFDHADLLQAAFPILNEVVRLLKVNPEIELVGIEGHTDDFGTDKHNDELSQDRANSVMQYLIKRGIVPERLEAKGFGERRPIVSNATPEGRQKNRRVELHILRAKGTPPVRGSTPGQGDLLGTPPGTPPATPGGPPGGPAVPPPGGPPAPAPSGAPTPAPGGAAVPPKATGTGAPAAPPATPPKASGTGAPAAPPATAPKASGSAAAVAPPAPSATPAAPPKATTTSAPVAPPATTPKAPATSAPATPPKATGTAAPAAPK